MAGAPNLATRRHRNDHANTRSSNHDCCSTRAAGVYSLGRLSLIISPQADCSDWMGLFEAVEWANEEQSRQQQNDAVFF
jgi:hypothetical protein